jgi:hypothetical protein
MIDETKHAYRAPVERRVRANAGYGFLHRTLHKMKLLLQPHATQQQLPPGVQDLLRTEVGGIFRVLAEAYSAGLEDIYSDADLTKIYNESNGLNLKHHNPITTERIFKAMLECLKIGAAEKGRYG